MGRRDREGIVRRDSDGRDGEKGRGTRRWERGEGERVRGEGAI